MPNATDDKQDAPRDLSRWDLFKRAGGVGAVAATSGTTLTAAESDILEAIVARLIPTDENGPGAAEARAAHYIDRALAGPLSASRRAYAAGLAKANTEILTHRPNSSAPCSPRANIHPMMNAVGGTSLYYWAQSWRLNPWDFKVVGETTRRYGAARIPQGSTVEDWPFGLEELEPYYDKVEYEVGISGQAGNINGQIDPRGNIFEGPRQRAYPMPPLRGTEFTARMAAAEDSAGTPSLPRRQSTRWSMTTDRPACTTGTAAAAAATSAPRTRRRSAPSQRPWPPTA